MGNVPTLLFLCWCCRNGGNAEGAEVQPRLPRLVKLITDGDARAERVARSDDPRSNKTKVLTSVRRPQRFISRLLYLNISISDRSTLLELFDQEGHQALKRGSPARV